MMTIAPGLVVVDSRGQPAAPCVVCGTPVSPGEGVTAVYRGQALRFKCPGCYARFEAEPERYLAGGQQSCCGAGHDHSPASEWRCD